MRGNFLIFILLVLVTQISACTNSPEVASEKLESLGVPFTSEEFLDCAKEGDAELVKLFLQAGMGTDSRDKYGATALMNAAFEGNIKVVRILLKAGAEVNAKDRNSWTPLMYAAGNGHLRIVWIFLDKGADANGKADDGWTALIGAARVGHSSIVKALLVEGADPNVQKKDDGWTALMAAANGGHIDTVRVLLNGGADVRAKSAGGWTAMMYASKRGHAEIVQLLNDAEPLPLPRYPRWGPLVRIERLWEYVKIYWVYVYLAIAAILISLYFLRDMLRRIYYRWRPLPTGRLLLLDAPARTNARDVNIWLLARKRKKKRLVVGSDENADIRLAHRSIEPGQAEIFARRFEGGPATYIRRLGAGRVEVNGLSKEITPLANDAEVVIGDFRFKYEKPSEYRQVQARFKNGKILEGVPATWDINGKSFLMIPSTALSWGDSRLIRFDKLKGVYFTQDWDEDVRKRLLKTEKNLKERPVVVHFRDDETLRGYLLGNYHKKNKRFYFVPKDQSDETVYILVERSSVKSVKHMKPAGRAIGK